MIKKYESFLNKMFKKKPEVKEFWHDNGQKKVEIWWLSNNMHRKDGPAFQRWYVNGQKESEEWWLNGNMHRKDGPAFQSWYVSGQKKREEWWLNGKKYTREEWINKLKDIGSEHYEEQKMLYDAEKYNL